MHLKSWVLVKQTHKQTNETMFEKKKSVERGSQELEK